MPFMLSRKYALNAEKQARYFSPASFIAEEDISGATIPTAIYPIAATRESHQLDTRPTKIITAADTVSAMHIGDTV